MEITNETILKSLNASVINKLSGAISNAVNNKKNGVSIPKDMTFSQEEMQIINEDKAKIETGINSWAQEFEKKYGRKPTYSDMRDEFG